ncbi:MAG: phosphatidate cytidylyltransferase [Steroidobacterales bacterium]
MLKVRVLTAVILSGFLLAAIFLLPARGTVLVFGVICALGAWEWSGFGALRAPLARGAYTLVLGALLYLGWLASSAPAYFYGLMAAACLWWVAAFLWLTLAPGWQRPALTLGCGAIVLVPAFTALARLRQGGLAGVSGPQLVLWLALLVVAADIGAFFSGRAFGRHKLAPHVSPGKTWEGALGGLAAVAVVSWIGAQRMQLPLLNGVLFGCAAGVFSIIGDLTESMFKRAAGLKDSGAILPGHGGVLDRIDSITAAAPIYVLGLFATGALA